MYQSGFEEEKRGIIKESLACLISALKRIGFKADFFKRIEINQDNQTMLRLTDSRAYCGWRGQKVWRLTAL